MNLTIGELLQIIATMGENSEVGQMAVSRLKERLETKLSAGTQVTYTSNWNYTDTSVKQKDPQLDNASSGKKKLDNGVTVW